LQVPHLIAEDVDETLPVIAIGEDVLGMVRMRLEVMGAPLDVPNVGVRAVVVTDTEPSCVGSKTLGTVAVVEVSPASGSSTMLKVAVETTPEVVSVTTSEPTEVTRLESGPAVSVLPTNGSISEHRLGSARSSANY
jgi:hypothetical protein